MYFEVLLKNGDSLYFDTEEESNNYIESNDDWQAVYVRGEFPDY